jgi:hypothetical protein
VVELLLWGRAPIGACRLEIAGFTPIGLVEGRRSAADLALARRDARGADEAGR